jgi:hypothetical protein
VRGSDRRAYREVDLAPAALLSKPFELGELMETVRSVLAASGATA